MNSQVADRYGEALFELAAEAKAIEAWQKQAKEIKAVFVTNRELKSFFNTVQISKEEKKELLKKVFDTKVDATLLNFLYYLIDKNRISSVELILTKFNSLCNESLNVVEGTIYSVRGLTNEQIVEVENAMGKKLNKQVQLQSRLDESLISGIKIVVDNEVFDGSMRNQIENLKHELLKERR